MGQPRAQGKAEVVKAFLLDAVAVFNPPHQFSHTGKVTTDLGLLLHSSVSSMCFSFGHNFLPCENLLLITYARSPARQRPKKHNVAVGAALAGGVARGCCIG